MKFKKTKLTALALSVLMAASTITSVTWAADLFTDGAPSEAVVEITSDAETDELVTADAPVVVDPTVEGLSYVRFEYSSDKRSVVVKYKIKYNNGDESSVITGNAVESQDVLKADCENPKRAIYTFDYNGIRYSSRPDANGTSHTGTNVENVGVEKGYIAIPGSQPDGHKYSEECVVDKKDATCLEPGWRYYYTGCSVCGKVWDAAAKGYSSIKITKDNYQYYFDNSSNIVKYDVIPKGQNHDYEGQETLIITKDSKRSDYYNGVQFDSSLWPVNLTISADRKSYEVVDAKKDAWYYTVTVCKVCGYEKISDKQWVNHGDQMNDGFYCEAGDNVWGFVKFNAVSGKLEAYQYMGSPYSFKKDDVVAPILLNCEKEGKYYIHQYQSKSSVPVDTETVIVPAKSHAWGNIRIETVEDKADTATQEELLLKEEKVAGKEDFVVTKDSKGNVVEAFSNNCTKEAKYALCHECLSPFCNVTETYGDVKVAPKSTTQHLFGAYKDDPSETVYTKIDDVYHLERYMESRICSRCGKKEVRENGTYKKVAHNPVDTKIKGSDVAPTCGENGSYQTALICKCEYQVPNSVTTTVVKATDKHDFGTNEPFIDWVGEVQIGKKNKRGDYEGALDTPTSFDVYARIVRKCNVCGKVDSNGIGYDRTSVKKATEGTVGSYDEFVNVLYSDQAKVYGTVIPGKKNPATGVTYSCSVDQIPITINWSGLVDGKVVQLSDTKTVPYYVDAKAYAGKTAHQAAPAVREKIVAPTDTAEGSYDEVIYCNVCGDEMSRKTIKVSKLDPAIVLDTPAVLSAESAGYNSVKVTWSAVEGAVSYRLYYRGGEATNWTRVKSGIKGTTYTYTSNNLVSGVKYRFTVRAVSGDVLSGYSAKGKVAVPKPAAPTVKSVVFSGKKAAVTWSKVAGANGYIIQRKTTGGWTRVGTVKSGSKVTWTDNKAVSGAAYRVRAYRTVENVNVYGSFSAAK